MAIHRERIWLPVMKETQNGLVNIFAFPYGGGSASIYRSWIERCPEDVNFYAIQLPGRSSRLGEKPYTEVNELVCDLAEVLLPKLHKPFIFFGHSMGALISFELARYLRKTYRLSPFHLIVSAYHAPHLPDPGPSIHYLPDEEFLRELKEMNGTPVELFEDKELLDLLLPVIRADFGMCETYQYISMDPLKCPITTFGGQDDPDLELEHLNAWVYHTTSKFSVYMCEGDHFFIHREENQQQILREILTSARQVIKYSGFRSV